MYAQVCACVCVCLVSRECQTISATAITHNVYNIIATDQLEFNVICLPKITPASDVHQVRHERQSPVIYAWIIIMRNYFDKAAV